MTAIPVQSKKGFVSVSGIVDPSFDPETRRVILSIQDNVNANNSNPRGMISPTNVKDDEARRMILSAQASLRSNRTLDIPEPTNIQNKELYRVLKSLNLSINSQQNNNS